ncbi:MAG TPA: hypothetical protein VM513_17010 [Kofleriaceae bacterium]|nr:hypothetical protein [Kofleriaceae bacterium]
MVALFSACGGGNAADCTSTAEARRAARAAVSRYPDTSLDEIAKTLEALGSALAGKKMNELRNLEFQAKNFVELFRQMKDTTLAIDAREELSQEFPFRQNRVLDALTDVDRVCNK